MASNAEINEENVFRCPKCRRVIGRLEDDALILSGSYVKEHHAVCMACGHEYHYSLSGKKFEKIVEKWERWLESKSCNSDQDGA